MKWFLIVTVFASHQQGDLWVPQVESYHTEIAMPSQDLCQQVAKMNANIECWAKPDDAAKAKTCNGDCSGNLLLQQNNSH